jgi:hypothetical protein
MHRYEAAQTTRQIGTHYAVSKIRVATVLREQGITSRRQGLTSAQTSEAAEFYAAGRSWAWLGARFDASRRSEGLVAFGGFLQLGDHLVEVEAGRLLPWRELRERLQHRGDVGLRRDGHERVIE